MKYSRYGVVNVMVGLATEYVLSWNRLLSSKVLSMDIFIVGAYLSTVLVAKKTLITVIKPLSSTLIFPIKSC